MPKYLHLEIPQPCHEDWNKMSADGQGRYCGSCQKTVTDFTNMSDAQLIAFFKNPKPSVCGRFNGEQLERDILIPRKRIPWVKYFFQFTLPAFLLSLKSSAQIGKLSVPPVQKVTVQKISTLLGDTTIVEKPDIIEQAHQSRIWLGGVGRSVEIKRIIKGKVTDIEGNPLAGASVFIKGTNSGVAADTSGNFFLSDVSKESTVAVSYVGYESKEIIVAKTEQTLNIQLMPQVQGSVETIIVAGYILPTKKTKSKKSESCTKPAAPSLSVYPNPLKSSAPLHLKWQNLDAGNYRVEIYNTAGVLMKSEKLLLQKGLQETSVTINELLTGNHFVRLINERTGKQLSEQFIVQE
jgi:hypothetical protein